ncbi:MAG: hypothetical protein H0Z19_10000 [Archaeoglobus sp.]|uniref:hypothetical protein n=1 Tax=Archaeoglobus sp. TaxID=1872626 RepID=UPI001DEDE432|nr:hypothetical protein [Archaeoglobus sp.]MBO8180788.1 hypothetical protein [Archaeoglobus sp.]
MTYGDINTVRQLVGITSDDISDADLTAILSVAERIVMKELTSEVNRELAYPLTNDRLVYQTRRFPIADRDLDGIVTSADIKVEAKNPIAGFDMWRELTVADIKPEDGLILLSEAPADNEQVYISYSYLPPIITADDINDLVNYLTAHLVSLQLENPDTLAISDLEKNALVVQKREDRFYKAYVARKRAALGRYNLRVVSV